MKEIFLDDSIIKNLREEINNSPIFYRDSDLRKNWNLICVVMDRLDSSVKYLNTISDYPESEEMFINFLTFACMIKDAVIRLYAEIGIKYPYIGSKAYFKDIYAPNSYPDDNSFYLARLNPPSDDEFFEYFRALAFAHPFKTDRHVTSGLMQKGEIQYAPWVIANKTISALRGGKDNVGVCIYSNKFESPLHLVFSFGLLKNYIKTRYELINQVTAWCKNEISKYKKIWSRRKVNRNQDPIEILKEVRQILKERYCNFHEVDEAIEYLSCELTNEDNAAAVKLYRDYLVKNIIYLCNAVDDVDDEKNEYSKFSKAVNCRPNNTYPMCDYHMSKIFSYLINGEYSQDSIVRQGNIHFGLKCAELFSQEFAKKYVTIDIKTMGFDEIKLLVQTACYLEKCNQDEIE